MRNDSSENARSGQVVTIDAKPGPIAIDTTKTAVFVVDMQNDFGAEGGVFQRAGIDISMIRAAVAPTRQVLTLARATGMKVIYLKMAFQPDLSDTGAPDSPNYARHLMFGAGKAVRAPNGVESRILIRDTWNTDIIPELAPEAGDMGLIRFRGHFSREGYDVHDARHETQTHPTELQ